jgi:hypothetical protein
LSRLDLEFYVAELQQVSQEVADASAKGLARPIKLGYEGRL